MNDNQPQDPLHPRVRWRVAHRLGFRLAVGALVLAVLAGLSGITYAVWPRKPVLITDGGAPPTHDLKNISGLIKTENDWVERQHVGWVSIAVLMPMDPAGGTVTADSIRHTVEGVYLAQRWANKAQGRKLSPPLIRVLLVDDGKVGVKWYDAVRQIHAKAAAQHIAAVVGLGVSIGTTRSAIAELARRRIAMVGSSISADDIHGISGLVRVVPPNKDQVSAVLRQLNELTPAGAEADAILVQDTNHDDDYAADLGSDFTDKFAGTVGRGHLATAQLRFDSGLSWSNQVLSGLAKQVCSSGSNTVLFAGRGRDLPAFLSPLAASPCNGRHINVLTGDDAEQVATEAAAPMWDASAAPYLHVYYAASAYPDAWRDPGYYDKAVTNRFGATDTDGFKRLFPQEHLEDGAAIMAHDGALAAITAVDDLVGTSGTSGTTVPQGQPTGTAEDSVQPPTAAVANQLPSVAFAGAGGWITFDKDNDPVNKAIPILELFATGKVDFIKVTSPTGRPTTR